MTLAAKIFHLAEASNWPSIQRHGLLSTSALLDLAGVQGEKRAPFERRHRPAHTALPNGTHVRDQKPMSSQALARCLIGIAPADWYRLINSKVFFWLDADRLNRQRRACEPRLQIVLVVETQRLLARHAEKASLSPFNTGNTRRRRPRGDIVRSCRMRSGQNPDGPAKRPGYILEYQPAVTGR